MYHEPVLLNESINQLNIRPNGIYADATFGGGGHSAQILNKLVGNGRLIAFDQDEAAQANSMNKPFADSPNFSFIRSNFRHLKSQLRVEGIKIGTVDGILADLGVSSHQLDTPDRGFSYRFDAPLDMRMDTADEQSPTAADLLNTLDADALQDLFSRLGEVRNARTLAQHILTARAIHPFRSTGDLVDLCRKVGIGEMPRYLSQVFQALRMEVNDELGALADFLEQALEMLKPGGRLAVITFHSIEDRMVKNFMKTGNTEGVLDQDFFGNITKPFELITKKALEPTPEETKKNPRSRSSKLRVAAKATPK